MRTVAPLVVFAAFTAASSTFAACSSSSNDASSDPPAQTVATGSATATTPPTSTTTADAAPPADRPGPAPAGCPAITKDSDGFFTRTTSKGSYVGYVPKSYTGAPTRLVVGMHGCGDTAYNFATWGVNPGDSRDTQDWIGISIDGASGGGSCWDNDKDPPLAYAAIQDISSCFYVHQQKIVLAGYSSGGDVTYGMAMKNSAQFAGLLIECSSISSAGNATTLLAGASWKINIAHMAHNQDDVYPLATVQADWAKIKAAGFPIQTMTTDGTHDGTDKDWSGSLYPKMADWKSP